MNKLVGTSLFLFGLYLIVRQGWSVGKFSVDAIINPNSDARYPDPSTFEKCEEVYLPLWKTLEQRHYDRNRKLVGISWHDRTNGALIHQQNGPGQLGYPKAFIWTGPDARTGKCFYTPLYR